MDRLTFYDDMEGFWRLKYDNDSGQQLSIDRLAAYEDTGVEPREIEMMQSPTEHLMELLKAEHEGRLVVLPCKVGDTVWRIVGPKSHRIVQPRKFLAVTVYHTGDMVIHTDGADNTLGISVFLTREEAEAALGGDGDA